MQIPFAASARGWWLGRELLVMSRQGEPLQNNAKPLTATGIELLHGPQCVLLAEVMCKSRRFYITLQT